MYYGAWAFPKYLPSLKDFGNCKNSKNLHWSHAKSTVLNIAVSPCNKPASIKVQKVIQILNSFTRSAQFYNPIHSVQFYWGSVATLLQALCSYRLQVPAIFRPNPPRPIGIHLTNKKCIPVRGEPWVSSCRGDFIAVEQWIIGNLLVLGIFLYVCVYGKGARGDKKLFFSHTMSRFAQWNIEGEKSGRAGQGALCRTPLIVYCW
jgi:hypothetical protein